MSLRKSITGALDKGPLTDRQLKGTVRADKKKLAKVLRQLASEGRIKEQDGLWMLAGHSVPSRETDSEVLEGTLAKLGRTFGFVALKDGSGDVFVPGHSLKAAMPGDEVSLVLLRHPHRPGSREGEIIKITAPQDRVAGTVEVQDGRLMLVPDNAPDTPLHIKKSADGGAKPGEKAAGLIIERGERHDETLVGIIQRFGSADSARQCAKAILYTAGVSKSFPEAVKNHAKAVAAEKLTKDIIKSRLDLREEAIFTIDSESTKDIDDAISAKRTKDGYQLCVHIADVSWYVRPKTALDEEAFARGTSIYYADSVIPMLPRALSNGACSLNPGEDRLAFSCMMELDTNAKMLDYQFKKSVIRSRVKGVYTEINTLFEDAASPETRKKYAGVEESLGVMREIYGKLAQYRVQRGTLDIESDEPYLLIDEEGKCVDVQKRTRGDAEKLIEEFMILANTAAAHFARRLDIPFLYRVHDTPKPDRVESLKNVLKAAGIAYHFEGELPTQRELSALLNETRGTPLEIPVHTAVLRSLAKALYEPLPKGHFGLALQDYTHFTSPIRRYPDLAIHRILGDAVAGEAPALLQKRYRRFAGSASIQSSEREQLAQQIERDCDDCYRAEYMKPFIGQSFEGIISSVTSFGLYVVLPNTVEGLVRNTHLSQGHLELQEGIALRDPLSGKNYRIGGAMSVVVAGVDVSRGHVDFVPSEQAQ